MSTGRRARREAARRPARDWRGSAALLVIAGLAAAVVASGSVRAATAPPAPDGAIVEPIGTSSLICTDPGGTGSVVVAASSVPGQPGQTGRPGQARLATLPGKGGVEAAVDAVGGQVAVGGDDIDRPPLVASALGALAPGWIADQRARRDTGPGRSLASASCGPAQADYWFVGASTQVGKDSRVTLVNADDAPAQVDLTIWSGGGPVATQAGKGVVVPPASRLTLALADIAPAERLLAIRVTSRVGRVAAAVEEADVDGFTSRGRDWLPVAAAPTDRVIVPGVAGGDGARILTLLGPGDRDGFAELRVMADDGSFVPTGLNRILLPAGSVVSVDVADALKGRAASLTVSSDVPVVAGLRQERAGSASTDMSFSSGALPASGPIASAGLPVDGYRVAMSVASPDGAAVRVTVLPYVADEPGAATPIDLDPVEVPEGRSVRLNLGELLADRLPEGTQWFTAVVTPTAGSVVVAGEVTSGTAAQPLITGHPWSPLRVTVSLPRAVPDESVALPD